MASIRVLLLEDSPAEARYIRRILTESTAGGFTVEHHPGLPTFLAAARALEHDVLLVDLCVPGSEGLPTFEAAYAAAGNRPVIVQSGLESTELALEAVRRGAQDYILKDEIGPRVLTRAIRYALERSGIQQDLRVSRERYALAMAGANEAIWDWDLDLGTIHVSERWWSLLGRTGDASVGPDDWVASVFPDDRALFAAALKAHLDGQTEHLEVEYRVQRPSGAIRWVLCRGLCTRDEGGRPTRMAGSQADVTRRKQAEERLVHEALHDDLTGLPNRNLFADRLRHAMNRQRRDAHRAFCVLFLDLDRFKVVNDSLGHAAGDELLREVATRLADTLRPGDTIARVGGDEFAILLEDVSDSSAARRTADRIVSALSAPIRVSGRELFAGVSIGIAHSAAGYDSPDDILRDADSALYHAKHRGGGGHEFFEPGLHDRASKRLELETDLRRALSRNELRLSFQPIVSLATRRPVGYEALLRWDHPTRGPVTPDEFIPLAEETGLIVPIGDWVLQQACLQARRWYDDADPTLALPISVNLSPRQLRNVDFPSRVRQILEETGLPGKLLVLEITENAVMHNPDAVCVMLQELRALGIGIDIDDFGTGWSSLAHLRRFPVDRLKIDRSFVAGITSADGNGDLEIVRAILSLAASLHIGVVAEGIETAEQLNRLRLMHCELGQGFLFARPQPADQVPQRCGNQTLDIRPQYGP